MYLKKLEIRGFKSFPNKTEVLFEEGVTSIVGPNGSGKSNISDAVRWVLGEQSIKNLRGDKLEDVIFAGTETKKPMNYCEVALTIDNTSNQLDIDYSEITIKRKAYKSGESEFFLNNKACRLKDIKELFLDTGIGKDGYSIIEQGKVDEILSNNPVNRRKVFDEACGISKYRYKKHEAQKNLKNTKENLDRINDIFIEIENQIGPLENQKNKALKYVEIKEKLTNIEVNSYIREIDSLSIQIDEIQKHKEFLNKEVTNINEDKELNEASLEELNINIANLEENKTKNDEYINTIQNLISKKESDIVLLGEKIKNIENDNTRKNTEIETTKSSIEELKNQLNDLIENKNKVKDKKEELENIINKIKDYNYKQKEELESLYTNVENLKDDIIQILDERNTLSSKLSSLNANLENISNRQSSIDAELKEVNNNINSNKLELVNFKNEKNIKVDNLEKLKLEQVKQNNNIENSNEKFKKIELDINKTNLIIREHSSKLNVYMEMQNHYEGFNKGVKEILKNKNLKGIYGALAQVVEVDKKYEKAIETALGSYLQNIITKDEYCAKDAVNYLKSNGLGRVTFLPLSIIKGTVIDKNHIKTNTKYLGLGSDLVKVDSMYKNIIEYALGRTIVVENMDIAIKFAKETNHKYKVVTLEGEVLNPGGSLTGGSTKTTNSILSRKRLIDECKQSIDEKNKYINKLNDLKVSVQCELNELLRYIENIKKDIIENEKSIVLLNSKIANHEDINKGLEQTNEKLCKENNGLKENLDYIIARKENMNLNILDAENKNKQNNEEIIGLNEEIKKLENAYEKHKTQFDDLKLEYAKQTQVYENINNDINRINKEIDNLEFKNKDQLSALVKDKEEKTNLSKQLNIEISEKESLNEQFSQKNKTLINLKNQIDDIKSKVDTIQNHLKNINRKYIEFKEGLFKVESRLERLKNNKETYLNKLFENYELTLEQALSMKDENIIVDKRELEKLKQEIKKLGNVNIESINEYNEVKERYDLYKEQKIDLEESIKTIEKLILDLEENMKKEFVINFEQINENFKFVYKRLFGGGYGELKLADKDNILESDIEITAQPPGKKMKSLNLLSGGEKALTAISILFSIIIAKPTPFCILDEIEAPLDDANIFRFGEFLKELSAQTQFIAVTHRRGTMEASDYIYGVTMQEKAISKVISLKLEQAVDFKENTI